MDGELRQRFDCADDGMLEEGLEAAVGEVRGKRLVVLPTDTVYGVAADAFQGSAVRRLLRAKGRGRDMPPPVLIAEAGILDSLASGLPAYAREMVEALWPGPLTLICTQQPSLSWDLGDNRGTVAVRVPAHPVAIALLERTGPLAVSSANRTGMPAAHTVDEAEEMFGDKVRVYLDDGPRSTAVASTILDVTGPRPRVLRHGGVALARLREFDDRTVTAVSGSDHDASGDERDDEVAGDVNDESRDEPGEESGAESGDEQFVVAPDEADDTPDEHGDSSDEPPSATPGSRPEGTA
ncbi:MAG: threonylcarbamoyl-AMP synthase [Nocardioidaceae bacterium]|nr:threonylcarbamoyl-AMP synthase [Nocardioidaceae bacterium]